MAYSFDQARAPSARRTQYFEMVANRGIYHDGWMACTTPARPPWQPTEFTGDVITGYAWELYNVAEDFSQANNLAKQNPEKLGELQLLFYAEAAKYNVLPLDHSTLARVDVSIRPSLTRGRTEFTYYEGTTRIPEGAAPDVKNRSFRIAADVALAKGDEQGVVVTHGGLFAGYALMFRGGKPVFHYNTLNLAHFEVAAKDALAPGRHTVVIDFRYDGGGIGKGGTATISVDGRQVAQGRVGSTVPVRFSLDETFDIGEDTGTPVSEGYDVPFRFTGKIEKVVVTLGESKLALADQQQLLRMERNAARKVD
jgi:arylsulfatase